MGFRSVSWIVISAIVLLTLTSTAFAGGQDWNDKGIEWLGYEEGLAKAKKEGTPICLIFYTKWCPHCTNYAKIFSDEKIAEKAKSLVMIRLDKDANAELSSKYKPDGEYIPRTYFLSSDGVLDPALTEKRDRYKYFYHEVDPSYLLAGMDRALGKLKNRTRNRSRWRVLVSATYGLR